MNIAPRSANRQIARAAGTVMAAFALSNITGLVRQILVTRAFGTGADIDAYNAASTFPDLIFTLIAGGALASAFVPTFTGLLARGERERSWKLASAILNLILLLLTLTSLVSAWLAPEIIRTILAPRLDPAQQVLSADLMRILLIAPAVFGASGLVMGILNAHQVFWWPALAPTMYWLGMIFGILFWAPEMGIFGLAWGAVFGAFLHFGIQIPALLRLPERRYRLSLGLDNPDVREVARLMGPRLLGVAVVQLNFVVNTILATAMAEGSLSAIKYAWAVMTMPQVVIAQAIAIAALPTFSGQAAQGQLAEMRASLAATLRGVIFLSLPAAVGLIILREPVVALLFERGEFTGRSTEMVAWALLWYTAGLVSHSVVEIVSRAFYAMHDTKTPVFVGAAAMALNVLFSLAFAWLFVQWNWMPHGGLALANTLATSLEMAGLLVLMRRGLGGLQGRYVMVGSFKSLFGVLAMAAGLFVWLQVSARLSLWWVVGAGIVLGGLIYAGALIVLRVEETNVLLRGLRKSRAA